MFQIQVEMFIPLITIEALFTGLGEAYLKSGKSDSKKEQQ